MALTPAEMAILTAYLTGHNIQKKYSTSGELQTWLDTLPQPKNDLSLLILGMQTNELYKIFVVDDASWWFANVNLKIRNGTDIPVQSLGSTDEERRDAIVVSAANYIKHLTRMKIINATFQEVLFYFLSRDAAVGFANLLDLMVSHDDISEITKTRVLVEINIYNKRWQSLGLSELPSTADIDSII